METDLIYFRKNRITTVSVNIPGDIAIDQWIKFANDRNAANMAKITSVDTNVTLLIQLRSTQSAYEAFKELQENPTMKENKVVVRIVNLGENDFHSYMKNAVGKYAQLQV